MREILKNVKEKLVSKYSKSDNPKKFKSRLKARIRKNKRLLVKNIDNFFDWIKGAEIVELVGVAGIKRHRRRQELDRVVRLQISGLIGDERVAGGGF